MDKQEVGRLGEKISAKYLRKKGYRILATNSHHSHNEIDIIAKNRSYIVFAEVKTRSTDQSLDLPFGSPASAVDRGKQTRLISAARDYLHHSKYSELQPRFDVIEVFLDKETAKPLKINHIENAFGIK